MDNWFNDALSEHQKQLDLETATTNAERGKSDALRKSAVSYMNDSGIYETIAQYFRDLKNSTVAEKAAGFKGKKTIDYEITSFSKHFGYLSTIASWIEQGKITSDGDTPDVFHCAGNRFDSAINLPNGKAVCFITVSVIFCRDENYTFTPLVTLTLYYDGHVCSAKDVLTFDNPKPEALYIWLKDKTSAHIKKLSPSP
ncbi:MAG: hypothetical protein WA052_00720 [Microgenomates group bacterium]